MQSYVNDRYCSNPKTVKYRTETLSYLAPKTWSLVPEIMRTSRILDISKNKIRKWKLDYFCHLFKTYVSISFN